LTFSAVSLIRIMKILVYGTGGVGGYLASKLWNAGHSVVCIARGSHLAAMKQNGLTLKGPEGDLVVKATFLDSPDGHPPFDLIIISVKSFDTHEAALRCRTVTGEQTAVLTIQNGVENEALLGSILGDGRIIGGVAYIFSTIEGPGVIRHHQGVTRFRIGEMDGNLSPRVKALERTFLDAGIGCDAVGAMIKILWEKFIFLAALAGTTAHSRTSIGRILEDPSLHEMLSRAVHETAEVGRAAAIDAFEGIEARAEANFGKMPAESTSSMYYDLTHGKRIEIDALSGAVVRLARSFPVGVPTHELIYRSLKSYAAPVPVPPSP
jgi:2-dehydropantoate 2-reductase